MEVNAMQQVLSRYMESIPARRELSLKELEREGIDTAFVLALKKVFENEKSFSPEMFNAFSLDIIIDYIRRTHQYYLHKKLLEIEQSIHLLLQDYSDQHPLLYILQNFYSQYKTDLGEHIIAEENCLLPYILFLKDSEENGFTQQDLFIRTRTYSLHSFLEAHSDPDEELQRVRLSILRYQPPQTNQTPYRILLSQLAVFEKDLSVHALIEEKVLIPRALNMEKNLLAEFQRRIRLT